MTLKHMTLKRELVIGLCLSVLTGCVTARRVELDRSAPSRIRKIALLPIAEPPLTIWNIGGAASAFGAIGGLLQGASNENATDAYAAMVKDRRVAFAPVLTRAVARAMSSAGYQVVNVGGEVPLTADGKAIDFGAVRTDADAILAVKCMKVGYVSPPHSTDYLPWVHVEAQLVDARSRSELYDKSFSGGYEVQIGETVMVPSDPQYRYGSFAILQERFDHSVVGLHQTGVDVAERIRADLARTP